MNTVSADLLYALWTDPRGTQAIVDIGGYYELGPAGQWPVVLTRDGLIELIGKEFGRKTAAREPTWGEYYELSLIVSERLASRFQNTLHRNKIRDLYQQLGQATHEATRARGRQQHLITEALAAGCRSETVAAAAGFSMEEVHELVNPSPPASSRPKGTIAVRPELVPAVQMVRDCWCDTRSDPAPILAVCACLDACTHTSRVLATPSSLRSLARDMGLDMGERGTPTTAGYTALTQHLFGFDLDTVVVLDATTDVVAASKADRWWIAQLPPVTHARVRIASSPRLSFASTSTAAPAAQIQPHRGVPVLRVWSCRVSA